MRLLLASLCVLLLTLAACGGDESTPNLGDGADTGDTSEGSGDVGSDTSDAGTDTAPDTVIDTPPEPECGNGVIEDGEECDAPDDERCSDDCEVVAEGDGICAACADDLDCGGATDRCHEVAGTMVCGIDCSSDSCPRGYECGPVVRDGDILENQCKPISGDCSICDDDDDDDVCDFEDECDGFDDNVDTDEDGLPDGCDDCPEDPDNDADLDGVCGGEDVCPGGRDDADADEDGIPNACDDCPFSNPNDADEDEVCDDVDACPGSDDRIDLDQDRVPDGCDDHIEDCEDDEDNDGDEAIDCADSDCARHTACGPCDSPLEIGVGSWDGVTEGDSELEPDGCGSTGAPEAAFAFVAEESGTFCANTVGTEYDTVLYQRSTCDDAGSEVDCDDDGADGLTSQLEFAATAGVPTYLIVDGFGTGDEGAWSFSVSAGDCDAAVAAALCEGATAVGDGTFTDEIDASVFSRADSASCRGTGGSEVVFAYTAPATGTVCVQARGTDADLPVDTILYVREDCTDRTSEIDCHDNVDLFDYRSELDLTVEAETTYYVFIDEYDDGWGGFGGPVELTISEGACE